MKIFAIKNDEIDRDIDLGYFFYYDKLNEYYIELNNELEEWDFPFILDSFARKKKWSVDQKHTHLFLSQRVIPSDRQNIGMVLKDNKLDEYDEVKLFILADGRCAQDECYIKAITYDRLPQNIKDRRKKLITAAVATRQCSYMIGFADGSIGMLELDACTSKYPWVKRILAYAEKLSEIQAREGGFEITFFNNKALTYDEVYENTRMLPLDMEILNKFALSNLVTTQDIIDSMGCSRQNINEYVKRGKLHPLDVNAKVQIFDRREYQKIM